MGGTVIETESDKIKVRLIIESGQEDGLDDEQILDADIGIHEYLPDKRH